MHHHQIFCMVRNINTVALRYVTQVTAGIRDDCFSCQPDVVVLGWMSVVLCSCVCAFGDRVGTSAAGKS